MDISTALHLASKNLSRVLHRYHVMIFTVLALGGLAIATLLLYQVISAPADEESTSTSTSFDTETIERLRNLRDSSDQPATPNLPAGRTDPF